MKATMQNWIDFAAEVKDAVNSTMAYQNKGVNFRLLESGGFGFNCYYKDTVNCVRVTFFGDDLTGERVSIEFRDSYIFPTDFDALLDEAKAWWNEFKTSDHPILIDNQIRKTLHHENTSDQL